VALFSLGLPAAPTAALAARDTTAWRPAVALQRAALTTEAERVVLEPADLGPEFVAVAQARELRRGEGWAARTLIRTSPTRVQHLEPAGVRYVRSFALVSPTPDDAQRALQGLEGALLPNTWPLAAPPLGEASSAALVWSEAPFDFGYRLLLFRVGRTAGGVILGGFDPPTSVDDLAALAGLMAARAPR
jgi:hypothetical protein